MVASSTDFPFAQSSAAEMLSQALKRAWAEQRLSVRQLARALGMKQATVISHMAKGRMPIPVERALPLAKALGMPDTLFLTAVLEQRFPEVPWREYGLGNANTENAAATQTILAGVRIGSLTPEQTRVIAEAARDRNPAERWLEIPEIEVVRFLRQARPEMRENGLSSIDRQALEDWLAFGPIENMRVD
jgi:transcriptional regulator with XRE-family HTH domain